MSNERKAKGCVASVNGTIADQLIGLADKLFAAKGECRYCNIYHPAKQCRSPRNASKRSPARLASYEIWDANQIACEDELPTD